MKSYPTEHPITWFRDRYADGTLILRPPFQRKPVWAAKQKSSLIESILMKLPMPEVYIQETIVSETVHFAVVDGQQRIRSVLQFLGVDQEAGEEEYHQFALDKLEPTSPWKDYRFADLNDGEKGELLRYKITCRMLETDDLPSVRGLFVRLNKYLTKLNDQELRNATYTGPFIQLAYRLADHDYWLKHRLFTPGQIRRMKDVEFASELVIGVMHGPQGGSAKIIDGYYSLFDNYDDEFPGQREIVERFKATLKVVSDLFPTIESVRWSNLTDFYSLFVALAFITRTSSLAARQIPALRRALLSFAEAVDNRLANEHAKASRTAIHYVRAVEKGANDKKRRADRHAALLKVIGPFVAGAE